MENSTSIIKAEIGFLLKEFKKLIRIYNNKIEGYLKNKDYFENTEEMINNDDMIMFSKLNIEYFNLAKEFRNFVLRYDISHKHISDSVLNDIVKRPIEYILHRRQSNYDIDSDESEREDEKISFNNTFKQQIDDISKEKSNGNSLKQLLIDNPLGQSNINKILKDSTINNEEFFINDILNKNNENTYVETPICIKSKKAVLNPKSNDNKSFQYSITLSLYHKEVGNNFNRITKIKPYVNNFNWNNINFPPANQDYETFELNNENISLNIYQFDNEKVSQLYKSKYDKKQVILLLLKNMHYVCIKNLKSLLN